ncbi:MAG: hypothetical protein NUV82_01720 [Candidatus Komeilibacteria bacterium]|nr:hypothetical protein [Candidatus Komeilibacteria bacterium]
MKIKVNHNSAPEKIAEKIPSGIMKIIDNVGNTEVTVSDILYDLKGTRLNFSFKASYDEHCVSVKGKMDILRNCVIMNINLPMVALLFVKSDEIKKVITKKLIEFIQNEEAV